MHTRTVRLVLVPLAIALAWACGGPATKGDLCATVHCLSNESCDSSTGTCKSVCPAACSGATPICNPVSHACVTCTSPRTGCGGATPVCDTSTVGGRCVGCLSASDCMSGLACVNEQCVAGSGGGGGSTGGGTGTTGGGTGTTGGGTGSTGGGTGTTGGGTGTTGGGVGGGGNPVGGGSGTTGGGSGGSGGGTGVGGGGVFPLDGGVCIVQDGGVVGCTIECGTGFHCENNVCVLNGANGPVQVTLRWNTGEDLDLHLLEPTDAGPCEIYYGDTNAVDAGASPSSCGAVGFLDLDSNPACNLDNVDIENIIYPPGPAPKGSYSVLVDYYQWCSTTGIVPYQVEIRSPAYTAAFCGYFTQADADMGGAGSGVLITTFVVP